MDILYLHQTTLIMQTDDETQYTLKIDKSVMQINPYSKFEEACLIEIRLRGGDLILFGCVYRSHSFIMSSDENNKNLNDVVL